VRGGASTGSDRGEDSLLLERVLDDLLREVEGDRDVDVTAFDAFLHTKGNICWDLSLDRSYLFNTKVAQSR